MDFKKLFINFFASKEISDEEMKDFSQDGIGRITANNGGGLFTTILNDTVNAHTAYFGAITDKDIKLAVQQSLTMAKDNIFNTFKKTVQEKSGTIQGAFAGGKNAPEYQEFFPLGLTEYANATMGNIEVLINRMVTASTAHVGVLGASFVAIWTNIQSNFITARNLQINKKGEVGVAAESIDTNRLPLELQWCKDLHFIGFTYPGNPDICATFYNQSLLKNTKKNQNPATGQLSGSQHKVVFSGNILKVDSTFDTSTPASAPTPGSPAGSGFWLYSADTAVQAFTGTGQFISSSQTAITWMQIGGHKAFVKVYNPSVNVVEYRVEVK